MSARLNSCNLICLTVRGLVITKTECHFQFQTLHSVTHINIESKDTSLQYFFISFLFETKKLSINRIQLTVHVLISLFTFHLLHV